MIDALIRLTDVTGQTRGVCARVADGFSQGDLFDLVASVASVSNAGVHSGARLDTSIETGDGGVEGTYRGVESRIRFVFDGLGDPDVPFDLLAPSDDCFDEAGAIDYTNGQLAAVVVDLQLALRTDSGGAVGGVLSATLETSMPSDELVAAAARLPSGEVADSNWWPEHGSDLVARSEVP